MTMIDDFSSCIDYDVSIITLSLSKALSIVFLCSCLDTLVSGRCATITLSSQFYAIKVKNIVLLFNYLESGKIF